MEDSKLTSAIDILYDEMEPSNLVPKEVLRLLESSGRMLQLYKDKDREEVARLVQTIVKDNNRRLLALVWIWDDAEKEKTAVFEQIKKRLNREVESIFIKIDDIRIVSRNVDKFKKLLLEKVNEFGGMNELSKKSKGKLTISNLSRFFKYQGIPQIKTLTLIGTLLEIKGISANRRDFL